MFAGAMLGTDDFDHSSGSEGGSAIEGVKVLSIRVITAFLVGFGWAGALFLKNGSSGLIALIAALAFGLLFMAVIFLMMRTLVSLKANGTLDYSNAIGSTAQVYVTIPAKRGGYGQVEIMIQGRLATISAVTDFPEPLPPQKTVSVDAVEGKNLLIVSPISRP